ncbi:MAG: hypothetical protein OEW12_05730, partial [Deltaproteobacteria bacterium]|nr:hypothetical protein [Deltaproteobacteria bacterium]
MSVQTPIQFFILAWLLAAVWVVPALADDKGITKVQAEGVGSWYEGDAARARDEALEAAQRTAVEQASGVIISTETQMNNFDLVKDEVLTASKGFIKSYKVVKEGRDDELYRVLIDAEVSKDDFIKGMNDSLENLYKRVGMPAVMVVVKESILGEDGQDSGGVAEKEIRKTLLMKGFKFIDYHSIQGGNQVDKAMEGAEIRKQDVIKVAKKNGANLVIFGMATTKQKGMMGQFVSTQAVVSIDVVRTDNNQAIASDTISSPGVHMDRKVSAMTAVKNAADKITPKLIEQVSYLWVKEKNEGS